MRNTLQRLALAGVLALGGLSFAMAAAEPPAPSDNAAADPGLTLIQGRCVTCHGADLVLQARKPKAAWRDLINEMVSRGAQVSDPEADQIQAYLEKNQSIAPPPP